MHSKYMHLVCIWSVCCVHTVCILSVYSVHKVCLSIPPGAFVLANSMFNLCMHQPRAGADGQRPLHSPYEPEKPVIYIVPITSILGRLPLIPAGDHGTIPAELRGRKRDLFPLGKCDEDRRPGTGSRLFYISSWAMCWPTDHPKNPKT